MTRRAMEQQSAPGTNPATSVSNGLFTVELDFGPDVFTGANRWLAITSPNPES